MSVFRVPTGLGVFLIAALCSQSGLGQQTYSPLPAIAAPPNVGSSAAGSEPPIVERPPARLRSGPPRIACWATPSITNAYAGRYIGGGNLFCFGQPRLATEGTWGWDYRGSCLLRQFVFLRWWHGRFRQGGTGAYRVDGPNILKALERRAGEGTP